MRTGWQNILGRVMYFDETSGKLIYNLDEATAKVQLQQVGIGAGGQTSASKEIQQRNQTQQQVIEGALKAAAGSPMM